MCRRMRLDNYRKDLHDVANGRQLPPAPASAARRRQILGDHFHHVLVGDLHHHALHLLPQPHVVGPQEQEAPKARDTTHTMTC